jgi:hypothetical protein
MPLNITDTVIKTIWENNADTPITASTLSKISVVSGSYLNADEGVIVQYPSTHEEYSILYPDPATTNNGATGKIILKRGTIFQIINEARDLNGNAIIPINEQYKLFDCGLDDIYIDQNYLDDDPSNPTLSSNLWNTSLNPLREYFIYVCDKDDSVIVSSGYGGGAQILVSMHSDYPVGEVPGRNIPKSPRYGLAPNYSVGDTRKIGGFKTTTSGQIDISSIWDVSGKFNTIKAKEFKILDEYTSDSSGLFTFRSLNLKDMDTSVSGSNVFASGVTINGQLNLNGPFYQNGAVINNGNLTQNGNLTVHGYITQDTGNVSLTTVNLTTTGILSHSGYVMINNADSTNALEVNNFSVNIFKSLNVNGSVSIASTLGVTGDLQQLGNVSIGGSGKVVYLTGTVTVAGAISTGSITSTGNTLITGNMNLSGTQTVGTLVVNGSTTLNGDVLSTGNVTLGNINNITTISGTAGINGPLTVSGNLTSPQNVTLGSLSSFITTYGNFLHTGKYKIVGISDYGVSSSIIEYKGDIDTTIFNKSVVFNSGIESGANAQFDHDVNVQGNLIMSQNSQIIATTIVATEASITQVDGNSATATKLISPLTLNFVGGAFGSSTFFGNEGSTDVTLAVNSLLHNHDDRYYTKSNLYTAGQAVVDWANVANAPSTFSVSPATSSALGGVIIGSGVNVDITGMISVTPYTLPIARNNVLGGVMVDGVTIGVQSDGTIFAIPQYSLPVATASTLGGVKIGSNISVTADGTISVTFPAAYTLPVANASILGGVKQGANVTIDGDGTISVAATYTLPTATTLSLGGVKVDGSTITIASGVISATQYSLPTASAGTLGGVKIGANISISNGTISVAAPYSLPSTLPATMIATDSGHEFVTDTEITNWNAAYSTSLTPYLPLTGGNISGSLTVGNNTVITAATISTQHVALADSANAVTWSAVSGKPGTFAPPIATTTTLGGVKQGSNITIDGTGVINATYTYVLPQATTSILGGVMPDGTIITNTSGAITVAIATSTAFGVVKIGSGITNTSGTISVDSYTLPTASTTILGGIKQGANVSIAGDGTLSVVAPYTLPIASPGTLGGVKPGTNVAIDGNGVLSVADGISPVVLGTNALTVGPAGQILIDTSSGTNIYISDGTVWNKLSLV